jgi:very-short-patch-repair endonuclease
MKHLSLDTTAIQRARRLRRDMTPWEWRLWSALKTSFPDRHWRKQGPFARGYTADFACHAAKLIIELDGSQRAEPEAVAHDATRTAFLESEGYRVLRFWNSDVTTNLEGVMATIAPYLDTNR